MEDYKIKLHKISTILRNMDQNRTFTVNWVKHIEEMIAQTEAQINNTKEEISKMKKFLDVA